MKINLPNFDIIPSICFVDGYAITIEISDSKLFFNMLESLKDLSEMKEIILVDNSVMQYSKDYEVIIDYFALDLFGKTILTKFTKKISDNYKNDLSVKRELSNYSYLMFEFLQKILSVYDIEFEMKTEIEIEDVLKLFDLTFQKEFDSLFEKMLYIIDVISELNLYKSLVFVNLKSFFDDTQITEIIKLCSYREIKVLLLENRCSIIKISNEIKYNIDEDYYIRKCT